MIGTFIDYIIIIGIVILLIALLVGNEEATKESLFDHHK